MSGTSKSMRLVSFRAVTKNTLRGFATVELPIGLKIAECPVQISNGGKAWAALPSKPQLKDGQQIVTGGKAQWTNILSWPDKETQDRWSEKVVQLVRAEHPEALA